MATRYIGDAVIRIFYRDSTPADRDDRDGAYYGTISVPGGVWHFDNLYPPRSGFRFAYDGPEAYDWTAASAVGFGTYYDADFHRDGGPDRDLAEAISNATAFAQDDRGEYEVRRRAR